MEVWREELYHHGIKGQKWGVRRYQNPDGTLTKAGRTRNEIALKSERAALQYELNDHDQGLANARHEYRKAEKAYRKANRLEPKSERARKKASEAEQNYIDAKRNVEDGKREVDNIIRRAQQKGYDVYGTDTWRFRKDTVAKAAVAQILLGPIAGMSVAMITADKQSTQYYVQNRKDGKEGPKSIDVVRVI